jgi:hypothetical protein
MKIKNLLLAFSLLLALSACSSTEQNTTVTEGDDVEILEVVDFPEAPALPELPSTIPNEMLDGATAEIPENCVSWFDGCNNCQVENGEITACTEMACEEYSEPRCTELTGEDSVDEDGIDEEVDSEESSPATGEVPNNCTSWFDGCNTCMVENGEIGGCTKKACFENEAPKCLAFSDDEASEEEAPENPTEENQEAAIIPENCTGWFDGCNNCSVENGKVGACTMMYCENPTEPMCTQFASEDAEAEQVDEDAVEEVDDETTDETNSEPQTLPVAVDAGAAGFLDGALPEGIVTEDPLATNDLVDMLDDCVRYFDGCNTCAVENGELTACTKKACPNGIEEMPRCMQWRDGDEIIIE